MKLICLALVSFPICLFADGGLPSQPYIYVEGKAETEKTADVVTLSFNVVTRNADQAKANQEAQAKATSVLSLLDGKKIASKDVIAEDLKSEPQYEEEENYPRKQGMLIGYTVTRSFRVKVRDFAIFPKLVDELIAIGSIEFSGIDSSISNEKQMQEEIQQKALINARERADKTLKTLGMKIDSVFAVSPVPFPQIERDIFGYGGYEATRGVTAEEVGPKPDPLHYRFRPVAISESVHVIYLISPAK